MMTDLLTGRVKSFLLSMLMIICTFSLLDLVVTLMYEQTHEIDSYVSLYKEDLNFVFKIQVNYVGVQDTDTFTRFFEEVKGCAGVKKAGGYSYLGFRFEELQDNDDYNHIMEKRELSEYEVFVDSSRSRILFLDSECLDIMDLELEASVREKFVNGSSERLPVIAGAEFDGLLKTGDVLTLGEYECEIIGFLKPNSKWAGTNGGGSFFYQLQNLDYCFVMNMNGVKSTISNAAVNSMYYVADSGADIIELKEKIRKIGEKYGVSLSCVSVNEILDESREDISLAVSRYRKLMMFMICICIFAATASSQISLMVQRRKIGIWYANGILPSDVCSFICMEQFMRIVFSVMAAYGIGLWCSLDCSAVYRTVHSTVTLYFMTGLGAVTYMITVLVPFFYIRKQNIIKLLQVRD